MKGGLGAMVQKNPRIGSMQKDFQEAWLKQLGTLGGGNHFIEVCLDESQNVWVMLHSGSRGIGNVIGRYFIERARRELERLDVHLPDRDLGCLAEGTAVVDADVKTVESTPDYTTAKRRH